MERTRSFSWLLFASICIFAVIAPQTAIVSSFVEGEAPCHEDTETFEESEVACPIRHRLKVRGPSDCKRPLESLAHGTNQHSANINCGFVQTGHVFANGLCAPLLI
jgi:hypothetical protein